MSGDADPEHAPASTGLSSVAGKRLGIVVLVGGVVAGILFLSQKGTPPPAPNDLPVAESTSVTSTSYVNPAGYVGPEKCAECHADRVKEFRSSRHYLACVEVTDQTMPETFLSGDAEYGPKDSNLRFQMRKQDDEYVQVTLQETEAGVQKTVSPISLMYGFGAETDEVYFTWSQNQLSELPMCWLHPLQEWGTTSFDRSGEGDRSRPTTPRCLECHNTWLEHIPGTPNSYRPESLISGVTCEVCHGPAREHVRYHENHPGEETPMHIVRPAHLSRRLQMDLCAYCHSNSLKHRGPAFAYRPGLPLAEFYKTLTTHNPEDDHVANQITYLERSKCYENSDTMTCTTCHNPHVSRDLQQRGSGQSACMSCHQTEHCTERSRLPEPVRDNCVGCHMPMKTKIQVSFDTVGDLIYPPVPRWEHLIGVDPIARDEVLLAWHRSQDGEEHQNKARLLSETLARLMEQQGDQLLEQFRFLAAADAYRRSLSFLPSEEIQKKYDRASEEYIYLSDEFVQAEHDFTEGRADKATERLLRIIEKKPNHAKAHGRLGTLYAMKGDNETAIQHWESVTKFDPDDAYGEGMIGWYWYLQNQPQKAIETLLGADEIEPYSFRINFNLALSYLKLGQNSQAVDRLTTANRIEPQNIQCGLMLNTMLRERGDYAVATEIMEKLSERTSHQNVEVELAKADSQAESGQTQDAIDSLESLQKQLLQPNLQLRVEISNRLQKLRSLSRR